MARRKRNERLERQALREMAASYLKDNPVKDGKDINLMVRENKRCCFNGIR